MIPPSLQRLLGSFIDPKKLEEALAGFSDSENDSDADASKEFVSDLSDSELECEGKFSTEQKTVNEACSTTVTQEQSLAEKYSFTFVSDSESEEDDSDVAEGFCFVNHPLPVVMGSSADYSWVD